MFSWSLSILFTILHVELWMPGKYTDSKGNIALMNTICDMIQFVFFYLFLMSHRLL